MSDGAERSNGGRTPTTRISRHASATNSGPERKIERVWPVGSGCSVFTPEPQLVGTDAIRGNEFPHELAKTRVRVEVLQVVDAKRPAPS